MANHKLIDGGGCPSFTPESAKTTISYCVKSVRSQTKLTLAEMCIQVDKEWSCGHIAFENIKWCKDALKGCKGPPAEHEIIKCDDKCDDCLRIENMPEPLDMSEEHKVVLKE